MYNEFNDYDDLTDNQPGILAEVMAATLHKEKLKFFNDAWFAKNIEFTRPFLLIRFSLVVFLLLPGLLIIFGWLSVNLMRQGNDLLFILQFPVEIIFILLSLLWLILLVYFIPVVVNKRNTERSSGIFQILILYRFIWLSGLIRLEKRIRKKNRRI